MSMSETAPRRTMRPRAPAKGDLRERALLETAETLLASGGFAAASVSDLAQTAGLSRAAFYFYFASKEALLASVLNDAVQGFNERIAAVLDPALVTDPAAALRASVEAASDLWWQQTAVLIASVDLGSRLPEVYDRTQANLAIVRAPTVALLLAHGRVPEASDPVEADALVLALTLLSERNLYHVMRTAPTAEELRRTTDRLARIWLRAFGFDETTH